MQKTTVNAIEISELVVEEQTSRLPTRTRIVFRLNDDHKVITNHFVALNVLTSPFSYNFEPQENGLVCLANIAIYLAKIRIFPYNSI